MGVYSRFILPRLVHLACSLEPISRQREKVVPLARGRVLEIGVGSGLNLPCYDADRVDRLWALEPSPEMTEMARKAARSVRFDVEFIDLPAEEIPLPDDSVDSVVTTYSLCTIPDVELALREMARVLRTGGELIFCEHGAAPDAGVRRWQDRIDPLWRRVSGGCHLNRPIPTLLEEGGFRVNDLETDYLPGWRPASFNYWGTATHA